MMARMDRDAATARLNELLCERAWEPLDAALAGRFADYLALLLKWNARTNLTAIRDEEGILARHFVESIACARLLPAEISTLLDFGSGAGFPGIPIALCRPGIRVTLAESQGKKAAFLQETVRVLALDSKLYGQRAEGLAERFDCVTLRAVDQMNRAVKTAAGLVAGDGWLAIMTIGAEFETLREAAGTGFSWLELDSLEPGTDRVLAMGRRIAV